MAAPSDDAASKRARIWTTLRMTGKLDTKATIAVQSPFCEMSHWKNGRHCSLEADLSRFQFPDFQLMVINWNARAKRGLRSQIVWSNRVARRLPPRVAPGGFGRTLSRTEILGLKKMVPRFATWTEKDVIEAVCSPVAVRRTCCSVFKYGLIKKPFDDIEGISR